MGNLKLNRFLHTELYLGDSKTRIEVVQILGIGHILLYHPTIALGSSAWLQIELSTNLGKVWFDLHDLQARLKKGGLVEVVGGRHCGGCWFMGMFCVCGCLVG